MIPHPRIGSRVAAIAALLLGACAHQSIDLPPVSGLYSAATLLMPTHVESSARTPDWVYREREDDGYVYGVGIARQGRTSEESLYRAMISARRSVFDELRERGAYVTAPGGLVPTLTYGDGDIEFERLGRDTARGAWYALARFDLEKHAEAARAKVESIDALLVSALEVAGNREAGPGTQVSAALSILFEFDRRRQYATQYRLFSGEEAEPIDSAALVGLARSMLSEHGVRVELDGATLAGVEESIESALGRVYLHSDEWGDALIRVRLSERGTQAGSGYLTFEGEIRIALEGDEGRVRTRSLRVVQMGPDVDQARSRAAVQMSTDVGTIVREALRQIADERGAHLAAARTVEE